MTRWAFIADVHGNLTSLQRAIDQLAACDVDHRVYLGDLLGKGDADASVELLPLGTDRGRPLELNG